MIIDISIKIIFQMEALAQVCNPQIQQMEIQAGGGDQLYLGVQIWEQPGLHETFLKNTISLISRGKMLLGKGSDKQKEQLEPECYMEDSLETVERKTA